MANDENIYMDDENPTYICFRGKHPSTQRKIMHYGQLWPGDWNVDEFSESFVVMCNNCNTLNRLSYHCSLYKEFAQDLFGEKYKQDDIILNNFYLYTRNPLYRESNEKDYYFGKNMVKNEQLMGGIWNFIESSTNNKCKYVLYNINFTNLTNLETKTTHYPTNEIVIYKDNCIFDRKPIFSDKGDKVAVKLYKNYIIEIMIYEGKAEPILNKI